MKFTQVRYLLVHGSFTKLLLLLKLHLVISFLKNKILAKIKGNIFFQTQNGFIEGYCDSWSHLYIPPLISKHFQNCTLKFKEICDGNYYSIRNDDEWLLRKIGCILPSNWRCYLFYSNFYISFSLQHSKFYKIPQRYLTKARLFALYNSVISEKRIGYIVEVECVRKKNFQTQ